MNGFERIKAALAGKPVDRIPVMLHNFMMVAREAGLTMEQYRNKPKAIADAFIRSIEKYEELNTLPPPDVGSYRYVQVWCEAVRLLEDHFADEIYIRGNCDQAPFSLASMIRGTENRMTDMYAKFAKPFEKKVVDVAHKAGVDYLLHICGNTDIILDLMKDKCTFFGNIDPSGILALGTLELVQEKTLDLLDIYSKTNRFVLNSGCAIPSSTPEENIKMFIKTAKEYR